MINRFYASTFAFTLLCEPLGFEDGVGFWGGSEVLDAAGTTIAKGKYYEPDLVVAEVNPKSRVASGSCAAPPRRGSRPDDQRARTDPRAAGHAGPRRGGGAEPGAGRAPEKRKRRVARKPSGRVRRERRGAIPANTSLLRADPRRLPEG